MMMMGMMGKMALMGPLMMLMIKVKAIKALLLSKLALLMSLAQLMKGKKSGSSSSGKYTSVESNNKCIRSVEFGYWETWEPFVGILKRSRRLKRCLNEETKETAFITIATVKKTFI